MYRQNITLVELLAPAIQAMGYEMLGIEHSPRGQGSLLRIYIDSEAGISLDDCKRVSEQVTGVLDVNDPIRGSYNLEVSSPGFDRPLFTLEQFQRFMGHQVCLHLREKIAGRRKISGEIKAVNDEGIEVNDAGIDYKIPETVIDKARLIV
jgi:ribosome maturation factor RimP